MPSYCLILTVLLKNKFKWGEAPFPTFHPCQASSCLSSPTIWVAVSCDCPIDSLCNSYLHPCIILGEEINYMQTILHLSTNWYKLKLNDMWCNSMEDSSLLKGFISWRYFLVVTMYSMCVFYFQVTDCPSNIISVELILSGSFEEMPEIVGNHLQRLLKERQESILVSLKFMGFTKYSWPVTYCAAFISTCPLVKDVICVGQFR